MRRVFEKSLALAMDGTMCAMMNALQWRRRSQFCTRADLDDYLTSCAALSREEFFRAEIRAIPREEAGWLKWESPLPSGFPENDRVRVRLHPSACGPEAPTVLLLHALMSANDSGYCRIARWFNARGWNAVFPHLPYHYSRTPRGYFNGELAITANLVRNAETLRQCVVELRQLMAHLRAQGCREFAILGTSFGGWNGALLSFLEADLRFIALVQPIVNVEHAIWENPGSSSMRKLLQGRDIRQGETERHAHLSSPLHGVPLAGGEHAVITAGIYDSVSPAKELLQLKHRWPGARLLHVRQGHFGYRAMRETLQEIEGRL